MSSASASQQSAVAAFRALHASGCFVLPNPWDVGSAVYLRHRRVPEDLQPSPITTAALWVSAIVMASAAVYYATSLLRA